jgi:hypothetical protein
MARRRMIDPGFWSSEHHIRLIFRQRLLFLGLISNADDEGRIKGNPNFIRAVVFPYDDINQSSIKDDLELLAAEGLIIKYIHNDLDYIQIAKWDDYQRIDKPSPSKIPPPSIVNYSKNDSKNDSGNDSKNHSFLKEKEIKRKEEKEFKEEAEGNTSLNPVSEILIQSYGRSPTLAEQEFISRLINKFGEEKALHIMKEAKLRNFKNFINLENSLDKSGNFIERLPLNKEPKTYTLRELKEKHKNDYYQGAKYDPIAKEYLFVNSLQKYVKREEAKYFKV